MAEEANTQAKSELKTIIEPEAGQRKPSEESYLSTPPNHDNATPDRSSTEGDQPDTKLSPQLQAETSRPAATGAETSAPSAAELPEAPNAGGAAPVARRRRFKSSAQRLREKRARWQAAIRRDMALLLFQQPTAAEAVRCHLFLEVLPICEEPQDPMAPFDRIRIENLLHDNVMIYREN